MLSTEYRWLPLNPLLRGGLLTFAIASVWFGGLLYAAAAPADPAAPSPLSLAVDAASPEQPAAWPRMVLHFWFLVPQLIPTHDR